MTFMDEVINDSLTLWKEATNVPFLENMGKDTLDKQLFYEYIIQDSIYLRDYVKAFAMGVFKSRTLKEIQIFYSVLGFVNDNENETRLKYLADYGMLDEDVETIEKKPACKAYTDFLIETAMQEEIPEILMAIMPCMLGYHYVFTKLLKRYPTIVDTYYGPLVKDYTSKQYLESCNYWIDYCNQVCSNLNPDRKIKLNSIFKEASKHELYFWEMAGKKMKNNECVRVNNPLVHCITNYVTVNDVANVLLACGGSPIMADDIKEVEEITSISNALVINIGTLNERTVESMILAGKTANKKNIPVVLDPVGAGASTLRNETTKKLLENIQFTVIRGNLSEISFIAGLEVSTRGVDSSEADSNNDAVVIAKASANKYHCIIAITGAIDVISNGNKVAKINNGVPQMSKITGTGCMLSAIIGAYIGATKDTFQAVISAITSMALAGEIAYTKNGHLGTGSLHIGIIDAISQIDDQIIETKGNIYYE